MAIGRRGATLIELVIYTGLFCLVGMLLAQMFAISGRTQRSTASAYAVTGQTETCMQWLRRDLQDTVLGTVRVANTGGIAPMLGVLSARSMDPKEPGLLQISEYGAPRWTKYVYYALRAKSGAQVGDLVRWEVALSDTEKNDRLPHVAPTPTSIGRDARVLLHNVVCPNQTVTGLGGRPAGFATDQWGGFRVQFVRRTGGENGVETMSVVNPSQNTSSVKDNTRLVELQLIVKEQSVGPPNLYSITFRVMPRL